MAYNHATNQMWDYTPTLVPGPNRKPHPRPFALDGVARPSHKTGRVDCNPRRPDLF